MGWRVAGSALHHVFYKSLTVALSHFWISWLKSSWKKAVMDRRD